MMGHHGLDGYPPWDTIWLKEDLWTGAMEAKKKKNQRVIASKRTISLELD